MNANARLPSVFRVAGAVAKITFQEILRERILYNIVLITLMLVVASVLAAQVSNSMTGRVLSDLGWGAMLLSCFAVAVTQGSSCISREVERRTILVALAKPIHRQQWLMGKYIGVAGIVAMNALLLTLITTGIAYRVLGDEFWFVPLLTRLGASVLLLVQSWLLAALALFFSSFSTASLAAILTIGIYFVGSAASQVRWLALQSDNTAVKWVLESVVLLLPNFELFQLSRQLTYGLPLEAGMIVGRASYGLVWVFVLVLFGGVLLQKREL
jgi:Cu-processing system permease protein